MKVVIMLYHFATAISMFAPLEKWACTPTRTSQLRHLVISFAVNTITLYVCMFVPTYTYTYTTLIHHINFKLYVICVAHLLLP